MYGKVVFGFGKYDTYLVPILVRQTNGFVEQRVSPEHRGGFKHQADVFFVPHVSAHALHGLEPLGAKQALFSGKKGSVLSLWV